MRSSRPAGGSPGVPGRDTGRAKDFLSWDLDAVQQQYAGAEWVKVQVCGPWTLAAMLEVPSGHRALTDAGAVDDLATSLAEGLAAHIAEIAKRVPGAGVVVQIDEPALPAVLTGTCRPPAVSARSPRCRPSARSTCCPGSPTRWATHPTIAHCCHAAAPLRLLRASGFDALSVDLTLLGQGAAALDPIGEAVETGADPAGRRGAGDRTGEPTGAAEDLGGADPADLGPARLPAASSWPPRWSRPRLAGWPARTGNGRCGRCGCAANWPTRCRTFRKAGEDPESRSALPLRRDRTAGDRPHSPVANNAM